MSCNRCEVAIIKECFEQFPDSTDQHREVFTLAYQLTEAEAPCDIQVDSCPRLQSVAGYVAIAAEEIKDRQVLELDGVNKIVEP